MLTRYLLFFSGKRGDPVTATLHLKLLGKPQVSLGDTPLTEFETAKAEALFYYLAVTGRPHSREVLVDLLWGEMPESNAKRNLTTTLSTLRKVVEPYLRIEPHTIAFDSDAPHRLDVTDLRDTIEAMDENIEFGALRQAVDLYHGDFLEGVYVRNAPVFEEWMLIQRERLRELMLEGLDTLVTEYISREEYTSGITYATRLLELDPWRESAHRQMMLLLARNGQRGAALAQYESCRRILAEELGIEPTAETTALYERLKRAQQPVPHNLPAQPNTFVGRVRELSQLTGHLDDPDCRLLTLTGPGGIGKTRLAVEGGRRYVQAEQTLGGSTFADGIYFVNLAPVAVPETTGKNVNRNRLPALLASAIADALNHPLHGPGELTSQLLNHLRQKEMLLILDNFEHLIEGVDLLATLLQQASQVKLLVTSRERLNLLEEWVIEVEGLDVPDLLPAIDTQETGFDWRSELESFSAIALFVRQARQVRADFTLAEGEVPHIVRICQLVQGIPLALVLAASWLRVLSCAEIVNEIDRSLDFLSTSHRNIPERHRSLRAVFEQSWQMLSDQEKAVFCKLSIFRGGFQRDAARQVARASLSTLAGFVDKSLLHHTATGRYEFHELLRQYAVEKLWVKTLGVDAPGGTGGQATGPAQGAELGGDTVRDVWQRYSAYYLSFVNRHEAMLKGGAPQQAIVEIQVELDNIRQAWNWAVTEGNLGEIEGSLGGLSRFFDLTGRFQTGESVFRQAADSFQDHRRAIGDDSKQAIQELIVRLKVEQVRLLNRRGLFERAVQVLREAADLAHQLQQTDLEAIVLYRWGETLSFQGELEAAQIQLQKALERTSEGRLPDIEAEVLRLLGVCAGDQGDFAEAIRLYQESLARYRTLQDRRGESLVLNNLGNAARQQGRYADSQSNFEQALRNFRETGDVWGQHVILNNLGLLMYEQGHYTQAQTLCDQGLQISREVKDYWGESHLLTTLGNVLREQGDYATAQSYYEQCLKLRREIGAQLHEGLTQADLALLLHLTGQNEAARDQSQQAEQIGRKVGSPEVRVLALTHLGHAQVELGDLPDAVEAYRQALASRGELGDAHQAIEALAGLARVSLVQGDVKQALQYVEEMLPQLETAALYGTREPLRIYLTCYHVLGANQDPRAAGVLAAAHQLLQERAANIADAELQRSFLENVAVHREIVSEFQLAQ